MNYHIEIIKALLEIVKQGGVYALWAMGAYWVVCLIKLIIVVLLIKTIFLGIIKCVRDKLFLSALARTSTVTLLSAKASEDLESLIKDYQACTGEAMKDFMKEATTQLNELKNSEKK